MDATPEIDKDSGNVVGGDDEEEEDVERRLVSPMSVQSLIVAMVDYRGRRKAHLSFKEGEQMMLLSKQVPSEEWGCWLAKKLNEPSPGYAPRDRVEILLERCTECGFPSSHYSHCSRARVPTILSPATNVDPTNKPSKRDLRKAFTPAQWVRVDAAIKRAKHTLLSLGQKRRNLSFDKCLGASAHMDAAIMCMRNGLVDAGKVAAGAALVGDLIISEVAKRMVLQQRASRDSTYDDHSRRRSSNVSMNAFMGTLLGYDTETGKSSDVRSSSGVTSNASGSDDAPACIRSLLAPEPVAAGGGDGGGGGGGGTKSPSPRAYTTAPVPFRSSEDIRSRVVKTRIPSEGEPAELLTALCNLRPDPHHKTHLATKLGDTLELVSSKPSTDGNWGFWLVRSTENGCQGLVPRDSVAFLRDQCRHCAHHSGSHLSTCPLAFVPRGVSKRTRSPRRSWAQCVDDLALYLTMAQMAFLEKTVPAAKQRLRKALKHVHVQVCLSMCLGASTDPDIVIACIRAGLMDVNKGAVGAVLHRDVIMLEVFLRSGADLNYRIDDDPDLPSLVLLACQTNNRIILNLLLYRRADVLPKDAAFLMEQYPDLLLLVHQRTYSRCLSFTMEDADDFSSEDPFVLVARDYADQPVAWSPQPVGDANAAGELGHNGHGSGSACASPLLRSRLLGLLLPRRESKDWGPNARKRASVSSPYAEAPRRRSISSTSIRADGPRRPSIIRSLAVPEGGPSRATKVDLGYDWIASRDFWQSFEGNQQRLCQAIACQLTLVDAQSVYAMPTCVSTHGEAMENEHYAKAIKRCKRVIQWIQTEILMAPLQSCSPVVRYEEFVRIGGCLVDMGNWNSAGCVWKALTSNVVTSVCGSVPSNCTEGNDEVQAALPALQRTFGGVEHDLAYKNRLRDSETRCHIPWLSAHVDANMSHDSDITELNRIVDVCKTAPRFNLRKDWTIWPYVVQLQHVGEITLRRAGGIHVAFAREDEKRDDSNNSEVSE